MLLHSALENMVLLSAENVTVSTIRIISVYVCYVHNFLMFQGILFDFTF